MVVVDEVDEVEDVEVVVVVDDAAFFAGGELEKRNAADTTITTATTATIDVRWIVLRRFAARCCASIFWRRAAFCRSRFSVAMGATLLGPRKVAGVVR